MEILTFSLLLFGAVSLAAYAVYSRVATARDPMAARLRIRLVAMRNSSCVAFGFRCRR